MRTPLCDNYGSDKGACRPNDIECAPIQKTLEEKRFSEKFPTFVSGLRQLSPYISE